ncbi:hypothetical protein DRP04_00750 [Archaeoglobales archaeon]|nr:MAG: hypothetical protein DRP04_00750 [Archaeoglobales archaeon]
MLEVLKNLREVGIRNIVGEKIEEIKEVGLLPMLKAKLGKTTYITSIRELEKIGTEGGTAELEKVTTEEIEEVPTPTPAPTTSTRLKGGV